MYVGLMGGGVKLPPLPKIWTKHAMKPKIGMVIKDHKYFRKIHTLSWIWRWRHDDVIILRGNDAKSLCYRDKLPTTITFERKKIESWLTPHFVRNRMYFKKNIFWHKIMAQKSAGLSRKGPKLTSLWRHNDVRFQPNFQKMFLSLMFNFGPNMNFIGLFLAKLSPFSFSCICIGVPFCSLPTSDKSAIISILSMEITQKLPETCKTKF